MEDRIGRVRAGIGQVRHELLDAERRGWRWATTEVVLVALVLLAFTRLQALAGTDVAGATANARALQSVERALHLDIELRWNARLVGHERLIPPAVLFYRLYYAVPAVVLVWLFLRDAVVYLKVRRALIAMAALALLVYWALPMSPPRFALPGVVDIVAVHDILPGQPSRDLASGANLYSAMPSLHVGWSALCAYAVWSALRGSHPRAALLAWLFPLAMVLDVLTIGAHYVLDVVGSAVLLLTSIAVARLWARLVDRRSSSQDS
ncbi:phosphatase PAP2 family protein [Lapillicoccus sp.]|uniref:phosphatase PAP2 family protein n=1 Tax=Lapillicoccus sp. TaxID=1909287 RepID=UPI0032679B24